MFFISLMSIVVMAAGLVLLHFARTQRTVELKLAGWLLIIGGATILVMPFIAPSLPFTKETQGMGHQCHHKEKMSESMMPDKMPQGKMMLEAPPPPVPPEK